MDEESWSNNGNKKRKSKTVERLQVAEPGQAKKKKTAAVMTPPAVVSETESAVSSQGVCSSQGDICSFDSPDHAGDAPHAAMNDIRSSKYRLASGAWLIHKENLQFRREPDIFL